MSEDIGNIHIEADLSSISIREAAAIQSLEGKLLGINPQGALGPTALSAANARESVTSVPLENEPLEAPKPADIDPDSGTASKDFKHMKIVVDLNQVTKAEAEALVTAERKLEGDNPINQIGGIGAAARTMANFNEENRARFVTPDETPSPAQSNITGYQETIVQPPPVTVYVPNSINSQGQPDITNVTGLPESQSLLNQPVGSYGTQERTVRTQEIPLEQRTSSKVTAARQETEKTRLNLAARRGE
ncbi:uncharacterized protein LOC136037521 [Artemia franciscana]|uniref:Uncharacterized protein n=1 Tax=Artemia franciscana TaxID=6661 RepID=A0AA88L879_ARTSF|nr:hypothetical protein QYM36_010627 [Artemia franciscana]